ncbi:unnamed protein product [Heterobilharzia americana]|nr:unnamed protein product [Heterobilharzia americana]
MTDNSIVVSAPTGSGKTVVFELAIVKQLHEHENSIEKSPFVILYIAPMKSLCSQVSKEWGAKFLKFSLCCVTSTGDTDTLDIQSLSSQVLLITTPEKINSTIKSCREFSVIWEKLKLCFIDEVHLLGEWERGSVLEVLITRIKMLSRPRFICVSATLSNVQDVAQWLAATERTVSFFSFGEEFRMSPVKKLVLGYMRQKNQSIFQFDANLNYKLPHIISTYSENKPVLIFCTTRNGAVRTANEIVRQIDFLVNSAVTIQRKQYAYGIKNTHLKDSMLKGVAYHHAGMDADDRKIVEDAFTSGCLSVLASTSTLAMGVNLPAHLVIIKNTEQLIDGDITGYNSTQISQMVGRAGRPQFDDEGIAIIMTESNLKMHYTKLLNTLDEINSCLKPRLRHHLLCEIILRTVYDHDSIFNWIKNTFFYVRIKKCPQFYGLPVNCTVKSIDQYVQDLCLKEINSLHGLKLIKYTSEDNQTNATELGELVFKNNLEFDTLMRMYQLSGEETVEELLYFIAECPEMKDIRLRHCEKSLLNTISRAKGRSSLRFPINSRIKSTPLKVVCLLQAKLGQVTVNDYALKQESEKIIQSASRILNGLTGLFWLHEIPLYVPTDQKSINMNSDDSHVRNITDSTIPSIVIKYPCMFNALELHKSIHFGRWLNYPLINLYNSPLLSIRHIEKLIEANLLTYNAVQQAGCKKLENILNEEPPFGLKLLEYLDSIPKYELDIEQLPISDPFTVELALTIKQRVKCSRDCAILLVGGANKYLIGKWLLECANFEELGMITKHLKLSNDETLNPLSISLISLYYGGIDLHTKYHFITLSNKCGNSDSSSSVSKMGINEKELSIGFTEIMRQCDLSTGNNSNNLNGYNNNNDSNSNKFNLWPTPIMSSKNETYLLDNQNGDRIENDNSNTLTDLTLPLIPLVNKQKSLHQSFKLKKCRVNIESFPSKMKSNYSRPCTFTWTPTNQADKQSSTSTTPLIQKSMLDYLETNYRYSKSDLIKHENTEEMKEKFILDKLNTDLSIQRLNRKRFKWDPHNTLNMNVDSTHSFSGSTFTLTPIFDDTNGISETLNISNILMKDNTPEFSHRSFTKINPLSMSCPPVNGTLSRFEYSPVKPFDSYFKYTQNAPSKFCNNEKLQNIQMKSSNSTNSSFSKNNERNLIKEDIFTPLKQSQFNPKKLSENESSQNKEHNGEMLTNLSQLNSLVEPYTMEIACFPSKNENNCIYYTKGINLETYNTITTQSISTQKINSNEPKFNIPKYSVVLKSAQVDKSKRFVESATPRVQKRITWSEDIVITTEIKSPSYKQENHWKKQDKENRQKDHYHESLKLCESEKHFSVDDCLINDGWCELACLIKIAELGLLHDSIILDSTPMEVDTPQPSSISSVKLKEYNGATGRIYLTPICCRAHLCKHQPLNEWELER